MPFLETSDLRVHYALSGSARAPAVILSNSLGVNFSMWDAQIPQLEKQFRVLRYDTRGHGRSSVPPGPYTIEQLAKDVLRLMDALGIEQAYFCGLSMGGMIGMWLGLNAATRVRKLVLCSTAPKIGTAETWNARMETVRTEGMTAVAHAVIERWLTPEFRARSPEATTAVLQMLESTSPEGYVACCAAVRDFDARESVGAIRVPAVVIGGSKDPATPPALCRALAQKIDGAQYVELEAAHLSNVEAPERFTAEIIRFLEAPTDSDKDR